MIGGHGKTGSACHPLEHWKPCGMQSFHLWMHCSPSADESLIAHIGQVYTQNGPASVACAEQGQSIGPP